ncbi:MAG TPA: hypothetical protein VMI94_18545 [Bryobacteraceae bacterium]|nr:hypothetical protein [Bryobacteraceae bacterium]
MEQQNSRFFGGPRYADSSWLRVSILAGAGIGFALGLIRCVLTVRENLQGPASGWGATLFLAAIVGGATVLITLFGGAIGFLFGVAAQTGRDWWRAGRKSPHLQQGSS